MKESKTKQLRGAFTKEIKKKGEKFLKREFTRSELRLYPYIDYVTKNNGVYNMAVLNKEEQHILNKLKEEGFISFDSNKYNRRIILISSLEFYQFMQEMLYNSYVMKAKKTGGKR